MDERHLRRTNKLLLLVTCITSFFAMVGLVSQLQMGGLPPLRSIVPLIVGGIVTVGMIVTYIAKSSSMVYMRYVAIGYTFFYLTMMVTSNTNTTYPYLIPILLILIFYYDAKVVNIVSIVFLLINISKALQTAFTAVDLMLVLEDVMVEIIISILTAIAAIVGCRVLTKYMTDNTKTIMETAERKEQITQAIFDAVNHMTTQIDNTVDGAQRIAESSETICDAMKDIADSAASTASTIEEQTNMTTSIQEIVEQTGEKMQELVQAATESVGEIEKGVNSMSE